MSVTKRLMGRTKPSNEEFDYNVIADADSLATDTNVLQVAESGAEDSLDIDVTNGIIENLEDLYESMSDTVDYVDSEITEATENDVALVEQVVDAADAVAGTGSSEEVLPNSESYINGKINTESIKSVIKDIWEKIKAAIKKLFAKIKTFWNKLFGAWTNIEKAAKKLVNDVEAFSKKGVSVDKDNNKMTLSEPIVKKLSYGKTAINGFGEISSNVLKGLKDSVDITDLKDSEKGLNEYRDLISNVDLTKSLGAIDLITKSVKIVANSSYGNESLPSYVKDSYEDVKDSESKGTSFPGNKFIGKVVSNNERRVVIFVGKEIDRDFDLNEKDISVPNLSTVSTMAEKIADYARDLKKNLESTKYQKVNAALDKVLAAGDKLQSNIDKAQEKMVNDDHGFDEATVRGAIAARKLVSSFGSIASAPLQITNHMAGVANAALGVGRRVMSHYKTN